MRSLLSITLLLTACTDSLSSDDVLVIASELHRTGVTVFDEPGQIVETSECADGGSLVVDGIVADAEPGFDFAGAMQADGCRFGVDSGRLTLTTPRSIARAATVDNVTDDGFTISDRLTGTFEWTLDGGTNTCEVDLVIDGVWTPWLVGHFESETTYMGTMCDVPLFLTCRRSPLLGPSCTEL